MALISDSQSLNTINMRLIAEINASEKHSSGQFPIVASTDSISFSMLDNHISSKRRLIAVAGNLKANEYSFFVLRDGKEFYFCSLYLNAGGTIFKDSDLTARFSDFNNSYIAANLVNYVVELFLNSEFFSPRILASFAIKETSLEPLDASKQSSVAATPSSDC